MYVLPKFRGKGINGKIIDNLINWAKERNLTEIQLDVYANNESALNAYKKRSFKPDLLKMRFNTEE
jgi:GNAT superfamily N-acetyltransferase